MIVTLKPAFQGKVSADDLKDYLQRRAAEGRLPKYAVPDKYVFTESIPKTSVGKLDKKRLRSRHAG
jgi:fatty-acyl-CoA synthase